MHAWGHFINPLLCQSWASYFEQFGLDQSQDQLAPAEAKKKRRFWKWETWVWVWTEERPLIWPVISLNTIKVGHLAKGVRSFLHLWKSSAGWLSAGGRRQLITRGRTSTNYRRESQMFIFNLERHEGGSKFFYHDQQQFTRVDIYILLNITMDSSASVIYEKKYSKIHSEEKDNTTLRFY